MDVRRNRRFDVGQKVDLLFNPKQKLTNGRLSANINNQTDESFLTYSSYSEDYLSVDIDNNDVIASVYFGGRVYNQYYNNITIGVPYDAFGNSVSQYLEGYAESDMYVFGQRSSGYWYCKDGSGYKEEGQQPNLVSNGDFESGLIGNKLDGGGSVSTWTLNTTSSISGSQDGLLDLTTVSTFQSFPRLKFLATMSVGKQYTLSFDYKVNSGTCEIKELYVGGVGGSAINIEEELSGSGTFEYSFTALQSGEFDVYWRGLDLFTVQLDNISVKEVKTAGDNNRIPDAYISNVKLKTNNKTFGYGEQLFQNNWEDVVTVQVPASTPEWKLQQLVNSTATAIKGNSDLYNVTPDESEYENTYDTEYGTDVTTTSDWSDITNYNYYKQFNGGSCSPVVRMINIDKPSIKYDKRKNTISIDIILLG